jgi:hypothetical protein
MVSFLAPGGCIVFSQPLQPDDIEAIRGSWWYIGPRNGHASIFTADALSRLAGDCGLVLHRGEWLHGLAAADANETSRAILARFGSPYAWLRLDALTDATARTAQRVQQVDDWHPMERGGAFRYRWTRGNRIAWHAVLPDVYSLLVHITVPFVNEIMPGFAEACTVEIGGRILSPAVHAQHDLVFETTLNEPAQDGVILHTPEPASPRQLRGAPDDRRLGLAIPVYPWEPPPATT